jgi:NADH-quinone oxidoreductase subunit G
MISLIIDDKAVRVPEGTTILEAATSIGIEIPNFCYHPKLSIPGNCRVCAVEVEGAPNPAISCHEKVSEGMVVHTQSKIAKDARKTVLEFVLINHPLDCPVCDCAGECDLQDYYFEHSLEPSRFAESKINKPKVVDAGPHVILDAERCVSCTRCIRFCEEIVGVHEIGLTERGGTQEIAAPGTLTNKYSLCTVDICPVGALLSKDFRFKKRVWFLESSPSICTGCATGCNTWIDHEKDMPHRIRPRENESINGEWMCDDGRMTYKELINEDRILEPTEDAMKIITEKLRGISPGKTAGVLSARATLEENAAFNELFTRIIGTEHVFVNGKESDPTFADDFLRDSDQNPNTKGAERFTKELLDLKSNFDAYIILGNIPLETLEQIILKNPHLIVLVTSHQSLVTNHESVVILPLALPEEQDGTLINRQGIEQCIHRALRSRGQSQPGWKIASDIAAVLGKTLEIKEPEFE